MADLGWLDDVLDPALVAEADEGAHRVLIASALRAVEGEVPPGPEEGHEAVGFAVDALDLLAWDAIAEDPKAESTRRLCGQMFALARARLPAWDSPEARLELLRTACLGWIADETPLAARLLADVELPSEPRLADDWESRVRRGTADAWLLLLRKRGWDDLDALDQLLVRLRWEQAGLEEPYLSAAGDDARPAAWGLAAHYHLLKTAELLAEYLATGALMRGRRPSRHYGVRERVQSHCDRALEAAMASADPDLEVLVRLLTATADQIIDNSLWTVARAVSPEVNAFVASLVDRDRPRPIFEVLPPQRVALAEQGLIRTAHRSVVVSLPTSAGKTLIAQFRILQALNTYDKQQGWVAYVAPNRALVNQVTRRLRRDFAGLGIGVERVSPALEFDGLEEDMLTDRGEGRFRVLVSTPEKLDLLLRSGWQEKIGRPLCLVVADEAHQLGEGKRAIKLELLLATVNREALDAGFLLLTPFIDNGDVIAEWLDSGSRQSVGLSVDWAPNDRILALALRERTPGAGGFRVALETLVTSRRTLSVPDTLPLDGNRPLGLTWSQASSPTRLAAATASVLAERGQTITLAGRPDYAWSIAKLLAGGREDLPDAGEDLRAVQAVVSEEFGPDFPLAGLLAKGIGIHHRGLPDDIRTLTEYLMESGDLTHLVSTTTIAQGVNFPVANVVLASHQFPYGEDIPAPDFWNLAGRAGRVEQGEVGLITLAATDEVRAGKLRVFVGRQVTELNSTLVEMVRTAMDSYGHLDLRNLAHLPQWSAFVQYLAHTYRQIGDAEEFAEEIEQILRGTLGFQDLRRTDRGWAAELTRSVRTYAERLSGQPLALVDSTGFSWESVSATLGRLSDARIGRDVWEQPLFEGDRRPLAQLIGVMLEVPELRDNLVEVTNEHEGRSGDFVARVMQDWVNGASMRQLAADHFTKAGTRDELKAITKCCQRLFGELAPAVSWGLSALQSLTLGRDFATMPAETQRELRNIPSYAYYGVRTEDAIAMRLAGVPRSAAARMAATIADEGLTSGPAAARTRLAALPETAWRSALGVKGPAYRTVWRILDGVQ
ncbi:DEAD/DEAH box helicase [Actinacidiphila sp. bgisy160]|uniref:DEAD/DEAH box helicase n=1 Tax=Actinacidiphila sp. bgisy160 TaxID=3413796 RepID=UPI003D715B24